VAIGGNGCGDQLILLPDPLAPEELQTRVFFWDHETGNVTTVADDFSDLGSPDSQREAGRSSERRRPTRG
jgi:hypothetical protein